MTDNVSRQCGPPEILDHDLQQFFPELLKFESTPEMEASPLYEKVLPQAERLLNAIVREDLSRPAQAKDGGVISALAWNIERGSVFEGIAAALENDERLSGHDVLLLTELDHGMARSGNRFVARELAERLGLNYAFAPVYIALQKGSGVEAAVEGENGESIHGLAMFSKWPMHNVHTVALPNGKDKMFGKEKRLGHLRALIADIEHPSGTFRAVTIHLDAHCSRKHRRLQMQLIVDHLATLEPLPTLLGGDWNTTTFNSQSSTRAILGYWRRILMGPKNVVRNHFLHPERYFEKPLFEMLERKGFDFRSFNEIGVGTLHYRLGSVEKETNLRDWVPAWCFPFIFKAASYVGGSISTRLDWFAGKDLRPVSECPPVTISELIDPNGTPLSDHDAIVTAFRV